MVFDGQSLNNSPSASSFPAQLMAGRGQPWSNVSVNGTAVDALATTAPHRRDLVLAHTDHAILVFVGAQSDLVLGDSAATVLADLESYANAARTAGADRIIMATVPPSTAYTGPQETQRLALNTLIAASSEWEHVLDLATATNLTNAADTTYYPDGLHWSTAGALAAKNEADPVLDAAIAAL